MMMKLKLAFVIANVVSVLSAQAMDKVIYGSDDRKDPYEVVTSRYLDWALSTAAQIPADKMELDDSENFYNINSRSLKDRGICADARFAEQQTAAICSGFLVGPDLLVTAGHCIQNFRDCSQSKWVFDYALSESDKDLTKISSNNVYECKEIIDQKLDMRAMEDYALIRLDRDVQGRTPLSFRTEGRISSDTELVVIGHPTGLPTKIADNAGVRKNTKAGYFVANLDTFGGNSGSAVFNSLTGEVEGILVRGEVDYVSDSRRGCQVPKHCKDFACRGEDVSRITTIKKLMQYAAKQKQ